MEVLESTTISNRHREPPRQVPGSSIMDALVEAAKQRRRPRDVAIFLILRYTAEQRRVLVDPLDMPDQEVLDVHAHKLHHRRGQWNVPRLAALHANASQAPRAVEVMDAQSRHGFAPHAGSSWGRGGVGKTKAPMTGKNVWRLCKVYGRMIGYPELKPHDLCHGVAMEVLEQHHDLEQVRALLGHARIDTDLREHPAAAAQARGVVLRGAGDSDAEHFSREREARRPLMGIHVREHLEVPQTRHAKNQRNRNGGPNGIRTRV
jgi:hypothetical protein